tara:strand:- start:212 stop:865 length:654 start_codon:yes stop_codon:yes gene_type:complete
MQTNKFSKEAAAILIKIGAITIKPNDPFTLTSGRKSPVYVDCRRIISFTKERKRLMEMAVCILKSSKNEINFDTIAGGETAGIPFAAWIAELMNLPMIYVRKKPKGFGKNKRIEGLIKPKQNILLVEDLATDGGSKISFINAIRDTGANCNICFVIFHYGIFQKSIDLLKSENIKLVELVTWKDILDVLKEQGMNDSDHKKVKSFLKDPDSWQNSIS